MTAEDRFGVQDLFARYSWAYDCGDAQAYANLFTPDAVVESMDGTLHRGRDAIQAFVKSFAHLPEFPGTQHHTGQLLFEQGDGLTCIVRCYWLSLQWKLDTEQKHIKSMGYYISHCEKVEGLWFFTKRVIRYWDKSSLPWQGPSFAL